MLRIITLVLALSLILNVASHSDTPLARRHAPAVNRMIKKRLGLPIINNAAAPQDSAQQPSANVAPASTLPASNTDTATPANTQSLVNQPQPTAKASATTNPVAATPTTSAVSPEPVVCMLEIYSYPVCIKLCCTNSNHFQHLEHRSWQPPICQQHHFLLFL
jgi:hypothetical protein